MSDHGYDADIEAVRGLAKLTGDYDGAVEALTSHPFDADAVEAAGIATQQLGSAPSAHAGAIGQAAARGEPLPAFDATVERVASPLSGNFEERPEDALRRQAIELIALREHIDVLGAAMATARRAMLDALAPADSQLVEHARRELQLAGMFDADADYDGQLAANVLALVQLFASQGHSGMSAAFAVDVFGRLARYEMLSANDHGDYRDMSEAIGRPAGALLLDARTQGRWQSTDGGVTWVDIDTGAVERVRDGVLERYPSQQALAATDATADADDDDDDPPELEGTDPFGQGGADPFGVEARLVSGADDDDRRDP